MCHAREPNWEGVYRAPKDVVLETPEQVARHARAIYLQAARSDAMPPANVSFMEPEERQKIARWFEEARKTLSTQ